MESGTARRGNMGPPSRGLTTCRRGQGGREPELVREVEKFRLDIVGLTSTHGKGSGTSLLEKGWTLYHSGVADGEATGRGGNSRCSPAQCLWGGQILTVVYVYGPNSSSVYPPFLESLEGVLESAPSGGSLVLLGDFNAHVSSDSVSCRGVIGKNAPPLI
ncbi:hypothetical protein D4764_08G0003350 [Takifugu flavidus]|uniref:Endonuclease/exonuclease/phosphatase domain-containing protein n=1 Tax=Takifugu flavidus TaxID=433684 RepID=A0A5C6MPH3_9TELE|nr:hypothetical protein D4764_08G0003350 [Takifugu flavidus]